MKQNTEQRYLNFNRFITQRATQILKFSELLQLQTNKRSYQSLPKSIRRRAMSHNRYRIPFKMRKPILDELAKCQSMQKLPKCRKHIRKRHRLLVSYRTRSGKNKWLNSHLWAAKRMKMMEYCGYRIAQSPNDKSFRSAYRYFRHNACLMDYSYLQCLTIRMVDSQQNRQVRGEVQLPRCIRLKYHHNIIYDLNRFYQGELYRISTNTQFAENAQRYQLICPVMVFPQSLTSIRCLFDPFALTEVNKIQWSNFPDIASVQIGRNKSEVYLLIGPQAVARVKEGLKMVGVEWKGNHLFGTANEIYYLDGMKMQGGEGNDKPMVSQPRGEIIVEGYNPSMNKQIRQLFFGQIRHQQQYTQIPIYKYELGNKVEWQKDQKQINSSQHQKQDERYRQQRTNFWIFYDELSKQLQLQSQQYQQYTMKVTTRSKYTHKRRNKLTKQQKKMILMQQIENTSKQQQQQQQKIYPGEEKRQNQQKMMVMDQSGIKRQKILLQQLQKLQKIEKLQKIQKITEKKQVLRSYPIMLASFVDFKSKDTMYKGCLIFCSSANHCNLWRALSQTNIKVIGRKQFRHCIFQSGLRFYPNDYPQSLSFQQYNKERAMVLIDRYRRVPVGKRCNYGKICSPFPFYFKGVMDGVVPVKILMVSRGRCFTGAYICRVEVKDYGKICVELQKNGRINSVISQQISFSDDKISVSAIDYQTKSYQSIINQIASRQNSMIRKIIGFVTYGGFISSQCCQGGIGYMLNRYQQMDVQNNGKCYVLVRKPTSRYYYVGIVNNI